MTQKELDDLLASIGLQHGMDPERIARAKERIKAKIKPERARVEALFKQPEPRN